MRREAVVVLVGLSLIGGISAIPAQEQKDQAQIEVVPQGNAADAKIYGEYPMAYRDIIQRWLETKLADPASALIDWGDPPKAAEYKTAKGQSYVGYVVDFKVNARNNFGAYTGKQKYRVVIRNGVVLWGGRPRS
jgi:hypothetical protein